jgi:hypothetical protein
MGDVRAARTNILIGIGGTGAKVVESALMLFSAGMGPREVLVGLVDQDGANGNGTRTAIRVQTMVELAERWQKPSNPNYFRARSDSEDQADGIGLNGVRVKALMDGGDVRWAPREGGATLETILGQSLDRERRALFDTLFMNDGEEQKFSLAKGYRGRAHVGAAAMMAALLGEDNPLVKKIRTEMEGAGDGQEVRIFIAGSAFGGTGAAGFPTLSRELHAIRSKPGSKFRGRIGGVLMLPYFSFLNAPPPEDGAPPAPVVTTDELVPKAQLAVEYYDRLFETEDAIFDRFYTVGWDQFFSLGYHADGAADQNNPPLLPELVTATAIVKFFQEPEDGEPAPEKVPISVSSRHERPNRDFRWSDLPHEEARAKLGQLLRFAAYWRYTVKRSLRASRGFLGIGNKQEKWQQGLPRVEDHLKDEEILDRYIEQVLEWAAGMERWSQPSWAQGLWNMAADLDSDQPREANQKSRLADPASERVGELLNDNDGRPIENNIYANLAAEGLAGAPNAGFGRAVAAVYRAARVGNPNR